MKRIVVFIIPLSLVLFFCNKKKKQIEEPADPFDKQALLVNMADQVILPDYNSFKISLDSLTFVYNNFKTSGLLADFQTVKQKLHTAYSKYQHIDLFEFGPAETEIIRMNCNVFPTDSLQIKANITGGVYDLSSAANFDAKGFPALDYLFFGNNQTENQIMALFNSMANRKQYVSDLLNDLSLKINSVIASWNSSYRNTFVNSLGTDVGSSIGYLVNQLNFQLDYLKNAKIGTPLGKKTLGIPVPEKCEAYFGTQSVQYALETLLTIEKVYLGNGNSPNAIGFDDYLEHLQAQYNGGSLNAAIIGQFAVAKAKLAAVPNPLSTQVVSNATVVDAAYVELVKLLVLLKSDMPSSLGVIITYQDGDGD